jgi:transposase, IS605 orfB family
VKILSSYAIKLNGDLKALENSITIYREALHFIIPIVDTPWDEMKDFEFANQRMVCVEKLIHSTKGNEARYSFDEEFPKFPSYLRRAVIMKSVGIVSSYRSNLANWEEKKVELEAKGEKLPQPPRLKTCHFDYPAYYKQNLFRNFNPIT